MADKECSCAPVTGATIQPQISGGSFTGCTIADGGSYLLPATTSLYVAAFDPESGVAGGTGGSFSATLNSNGNVSSISCSGGSGYGPHTQVWVAAQCALPADPSITSVCGVPMNANLATRGNRPGLAYSANSITNLPNNIKRGFNFYYLTSTGINNNLPSVFFLHPGGDTQGTVGYGHLAQGQYPSVLGSLVHSGLNYYEVAYQLTTIATGSPINSTSTAQNIYVSLPWWPTTSNPSYYIEEACDNTGKIEAMQVTAQGGSLPNLALTISRGGLGTSACSHTSSNQLVWVVDSNGVSPAMPAALQDVATFLSFYYQNAGNGMIPGNPLDFRGLGFSHGTYQLAMLRALGAKQLSPNNNEWAAPTNAVFQQAFTYAAGGSIPAENRAITGLNLICNATQNCSLGGAAPAPPWNGDGTEPSFVQAQAGPAWAAGWGGSDNNHVPVATVDPYTCLPDGLAVTLVNGGGAAATYAQNTGPQAYWAGGQCANGGGNCFGKPLASMTPLLVTTGPQDGDVTEPVQSCFASTVPGITQLLVGSGNDCGDSGHHHPDHDACWFYSPGCNTGSDWCTNSPAVQAVMNYLAGDSGLPSFTLSSSPASLSVAQGDQGISTITSTIISGFNNSISLSASGMPSGTMVSFNPNPIPAPGSGNSTMTITVGSGTPTGTYPITVTGNGGGVQQNTTVTLTVTSSGGGGGWQQGFDFRSTSNFVTDPAGDTYVLPSTAYPTKGSGVTYGWVKTSGVSGSNRNAKLDPRLAGINYVSNGAPGTFYVDLPSAGTYNLSLAMGDATYTQCYTQCQIQFLDGNTVLATVAMGRTLASYFYDTKANNWSAAQWPTKNVSQQVTLSGTRLTVVVGLSKSNGDITPITFLGVSQKQ